MFFDMLFSAAGTCSRVCALRLSDDFAHFLRASGLCILRSTRRLHGVRVWTSVVNVHVHAFWATLDATSRSGPPSVFGALHSGAGRGVMSTGTWLPTICLHKSKDIEKHTHTHVLQQCPNHNHLLNHHT